jgi:YD repeat-containing protein
LSNIWSTRLLRIAEAESLSSIKANEVTVKGTNAVFASPTYFTYDKNGSVITQVQGANTTKFAYNPAGLVSKILWNDASSTYFYYDGKLQRYALRQGSTLNYFLWDGMDTLQELNADGTVKEEYTQAKNATARRTKSP